MTDVADGTYLIKIVITLNTNGTLRVKWSGVVVTALTRKRDGAVLEFSTVSAIRTWMLDSFINVGA